jgi:hypothetical protein
MMLQTTTRCILRRNLLKRNYTKEAAVIGSTPDKNTPEYQVGYCRGCKSPRIQYYCTKQKIYALR